MKTLTIGVLTGAMLLSGCTSVGKYHVDSSAMDHADMHFVGIPTLFTAIGSSYPITPEYSLTAAHVAKVMLVKVKAYHPTCDLAIIYHNNKDVKVFPKLRAAIKGEAVSTYGYNAYTYLPSSGKGTIKDLAWYTGKPDSCWIAASDAGVVAGMSGGPAIAKDGAVIGTIFGVNNRLHVSLFVPYQTVSKWIEENTK